MTFTETPDLHTRVHCDNCGEHTDYTGRENWLCLHRLDASLNGCPTLCSYACLLEYTAKLHRMAIQAQLAMQAKLAGSP